MDATGWIAVMLGCLAAADDLRRRVISNWISLGAMAASLCYQLVRHGWTGMLMAAAGAAVGFAVFLLFYFLGGMGGGDLKLMAAFGSLLGPSGILVAALLTSGIGAVFAACCFVLNPKRRAIPYAPAIVLGSWLVLLARR
jgi:prepilin peptidase CpaA